MSDFRRVAHLEEQLGPERFRALICPDNTGKVKEFCDNLIKASLPTEMIIGGRVYEVLSLLEGEDSVRVDTIVARAEGRMNVHLGKDDCEFLLAHQGEIPAAFRGEVAFVFTDSRRPVDREGVAFVHWDGDGWYQGWLWLGLGWNDYYRVLRRKSA